MKGFSFSIRMVVVFVISIVVILLVSALFGDSLVSPAKSLSKSMIELNFGNISG
ncbi:MAG: hypothetical protein ABEJ91_02330 [Candidatus Nanohaloarchaea archaeon]